MKRLLQSSIALCALLAYVPAVTAADVTATTIASDLNNPVLSEQDKIFAAIDSGNLQSIQAHVDFVRAFLQLDPNYNPAQGINFEFRDADGNTPLIRAAMQKNVSVVGYLLNNGARINAVNRQHETALMVAYRSDNTPVARYLLSRGAVDNQQVAQQVRQHAAEADSGSGTQTLLLEAGAGAAGIAAVSLIVGSGSANTSSPSSGGTSQLPFTVPADDSLHPLHLDPNTLNTAESQAMEGVDPMGVLYAHARGYDGSIYDRASDGTLNSTTPTGHVKVAVVDTGVDMTHADLAANMLTSDSVTCDDNGCIAGGSDQGVTVSGEQIYHGTWVAGIIGALSNGTGVQGIAPGARMMSIGFSDGTNLTFGDIPGIKIALDNGAQVLNGSYGTDLTATTATTGDVLAIVNQVAGGTTYLAQFQRGVTNHAIFVFAAGNSALADPEIPAGLPYYFQGATAPSGMTQNTYDTVNAGHLDWSKNFVAAVSVDSSNTISSFSNKCGVAANWCLAAPGELTSSTQNGGGYSGAIEGTSFAAPNITGAIAVMLGAFPQLTPEAVLQILFDTATDLGAPGVDVVYGHGLVNLEKATDPSDGGWTISGGSVHSFYTSGFNLSAPFGNAGAGTQMRIQFLDSYGKNYSIPLQTMSSSLTNPNTSFDKFQRFATDEFTSVISLGQNASFRFTPADSNSTGSVNGLGKMSYAASMPMGEGRTASVALNYQTDLAAALAGTNRIAGSEAFKDPYVSLMDVSNSSVIGYRLGQTQVTMAAYQGKFDNNEYNYHFGSSKNISGLYSELRYASNDNRSVTGLSNGMVTEKNSLLGSEMNGAFGIAKAVTYHAGLSERYQLTGRLSLHGEYHLGMTQVAADGNSLFTGFGTIKTDSFAAGLELAKPSNDNDVAGFVVSQPLRVTGGTASLNLPVGMLATGETVYQQGSLNLAPTARELDFETYYGMTMSDHEKLGFDAAYRLNPGNSNATANDTTVMAKYSLNF